MIKNVIFDIGMVLVDFAWKAEMEDLGFDKECIDALDKGFVNSVLWDELDLGVLPESEVIAKAKNAIPKYAEEIELFWENRIGTIRPFPYSEPWIRSLRENGLNVFLLTNYPDSLFEKSVKEAFPFYRYINGEIVSSRIKCRKPDPFIYETLMKKYDLKPEESIFTDDRIINVEAASKLGINAVHFTSYEEARKAIDKIILENR